MRGLPRLWLALVFVLACDGRSDQGREPSARSQAKEPVEARPRASERRVIKHEQAEWLVFEFDLAEVKLELLGQAAGEPQSFDALKTFLKERGDRLRMATNAGIFDAELHPVGLHIERTEELHPISTADGSGNFFLKPNGIFWVDERGAHVAATGSYRPHGPVQLATQSGPLLLDRGIVHPSFSSPGSSLKVRSAVGVDRQGHVVFVLSRSPVSFIDTATLFRDVLACDHALYLDGEISAVLTKDGVEGRAHSYAGLLVATER
jgi:uncharacterized protein YigE (DUF2233 family)